MPTWSALDMAIACRMLRNYNLTEAQKNDYPTLMAGYCRLLDDAGIIGYGHTKKQAKDDAAWKSRRYRILRYMVPAGAELASAARMVMDVYGSLVVDSPALDRLRGALKAYDDEVVK
jgi:hypothetical protein